MSRVLVTGATTPLGRALVRALADDPAVERVLAVGVEPSPGWPRDGRVVYLTADLSRSRDRRSLLFGPARDLGIDSLVHLALHRAATATGKRVHALNVECLRELMHLLERHPTIRHVVYRSHAEVYKLEGEAPSILDEEHPLDLSPGAPQWVRDRVEADQIMCTYLGLSPARIVVLRCAEVLAADSGSQILDYVRSKVCFRPLGYDPMVQLLTIDDAVEALVSALRARSGGIFNIPGADTLPLSEIIRRCRRIGIPVPGPLLTPLYRLRTLALGTQFRYDLNMGRFHFSGVLDGRRALRILGYVPTHPIAWGEIARLAPAGGASAGANGVSAR